MSKKYKIVIRFDRYCLSYSEDGGRTSSLINLPNEICFEDRKCLLEILNKEGPIGTCPYCGKEIA